MDMSGTQECPVDCIHEGDPKVFTDPKDHIGCGAREAAYPLEDTAAQRRVGQERPEPVQDSRRSFTEALPVRGARIQASGGWYTSAPIGAHTPMPAER